MEALDASLGGQWRLQKWLPRQAEVYENDYRWSISDTPALATIAEGQTRDSAVSCDSDVEGFYYEWNGAYYRIVIDDNFVCIA